MQQGQPTGQGMSGRRGLRNAVIYHNQYCRENKMDGSVIRPGLLTRERTVARPGYNRWLLPPAALAIHLSIGMIYGMSVFWLPLSQAVGIAHPRACPAGTSIFQRLTATDCDWTVANVSVVFTLGIVFLGISAALWGASAWGSATSRRYPR